MARLVYKFSLLSQYLSQLNYLLSGLTYNEFHTLGTYLFNFYMGSTKYVSL